MPEPIVRSSPAWVAGEDDVLRETEWLAAVREGDGVAFEKLCALHAPRLLRQALALDADPGRAEELSQDTLVAAWESRARFNGECRYFTWLCAILLHRHRRQLRARRTWLRWFLPDTSAEDSTAVKDYPDRVRGPDQALAEREREAQLRRCLAALPAKQADVVFLRFYQDCSLEEIAVALDISLGTVKSRLFHALDKLRQMKEVQDIVRVGERNR